MRLPASQATAGGEGDGDERKDPEHKADEGGDGRSESDQTALGDEQSSAALLPDDRGVAPAAASFQQRGFEVLGSAGLGGRPSRRRRFFCSVLSAAQGALVVEFEVKVRNFCPLACFFLYLLEAWCRNGTPVKKGRATRSKKRKRDENKKVPAGDVQATEGALTEKNN